MMRHVLLVHMRLNKDAKPNPRMQETMMRVVGSASTSVILVSIVFFVPFFSLMSVGWICERS